MKLELKHIVGYLPYELKYKDKPEGFNEIRTLCINTIGWFLYEGKPILRPLSDLTKEIEVNGESFVPAKYLNKNCEKFYLPENWDAVLFIEPENVLSVNYAIIKKLYEWHFDIHGLIEKGLAIDINTLNK